MNNGRNLDYQPPGISLVDIYFVVFRRKWLILFFTALGLIASAVFFFTHQPLYQSSAKLMIKYVSDTRPVNPGDNGSQLTSTTELNQSLMNSEMQILTSFDLFEQVATNVGPEKILAKIGGGSDPISAAESVNRGLHVEPLRDSTTIVITFSHSDQNIVRPVLASVMDAYREKHMQVHKSIGFNDDYLLEKTSDLQQQISAIDEEVRIAKTNAGVIDIAEAEKACSEEIAHLRRDLFQAELELSEHQATLSEASLNRAGRIGGTNALGAELKISDDMLTRYKAVCARLVYLQRRETDYLSNLGYTETNRLVKENHEQMAATSKLKNTLEEQCPPLAALDFSEVSTAASGLSANGQQSSAAGFQMTSLPTRIKTLRSQLAQVQSEAIKLGDAETKITELTRKKKIKESYFDNIKSTLERKQIDDTLGPGQMFSNIPKIQAPTPPFRDFKKFYKNIVFLIFGGLGIGLALAFLIEFYLDRSIKRPIEVQTKLGIPFFLSIPDLNQHTKRRLPIPGRKLLGGGVAAVGGAVAVREASLEIMSSEVNRRFDSYYDALRDRLVVYFESINLTRKPKLVAVTSTHKGAGVSTIAAGLAQSLSETGDGRVLLVDMNLENGAAQQFFKGKPNCKLDDALESDTRDSARVQENLYVVTEDTVTDRLPRVLPKRFASLIPKLKASDYDYIIFDMPPVSPTSVTARLSGFMDTVMLVIESEKTDQQVVQQANALLKQSKANVTAVLNKTKTYIPKHLHQDFLSET